MIFAIIYAFLWSAGLGAPTLIWGAIFGLVHGLIAAVMMPAMLRMHPRPPDMETGPMMVVGLLAGHIVYGIVVALVYGQLTG